MNDQKKYPVELGKAYVFRTVTHIELGRVTDVIGAFAKIEEASWIADTGRYSVDFLTKGDFSDEYSEVEPYPDHTWVNMDSLINLVPWPHKLPREVK